MVTAQQAIAWHDQLLGRRDNGGSFIWRLVIKPFGFAAWYDGLAYCGATQLALCHALGLDTKPMTDPKRLVYVPWVVADAKKAGLWISDIRQAKAGDWAINDWEPDGSADHITMVKSVSGDYITVVGGNHGDGTGRGERGVFVRTWHRRYFSGAVNRQHAYTQPPAVTPPTTTKPADAPRTLAVGDTGSDVKKFQSWLLAMFPAYAGPIKTSGGADGIFGRGTKQVVAEWQRRSGLTADGAFGPRSLAVAKRQGYKP